MRSYLLRSSRLTGWLSSGCLAAFISLAGTASVCPAGSPGFPWHGPSSASPVSAGGVPVRTLTQPVATPIEPLPPKQTYPYGWFGSKPAYHWKRSFGVSKAYTQWSRY